MLCYSESRGKIVNVRVDRISNIDVLEETIYPAPANFDVSKYLKSSFAMFSGTSEPVTLRINKKLANAVFDKFGFEIYTREEDEEHFLITVDVKTEEPHTFFSWLYLLNGNAEIVKPESLRKAFKEDMRHFLNNLYK